MSSSLYRISRLQSRAVTQENPRGLPGAGGRDRGNGNGRKGAPAFRHVKPGETKELCDVRGPGMVRHLWVTMEDRSPAMLRSCVLRIYWDGADIPSVEAPLGDFFGVAHGRTSSYMSPFLGTPEGRGFQCYFPMPFRRRCRITFHNDSDREMPWLFYQVDYTVGDRIGRRDGLFHARFRRENPCPAGTDYQLLSVSGAAGRFVGAVIGVNPKAPGWWGEGEMKIYLDGDTTWPTICGTGTEDYLCSGWGMEKHSALYTGVNYLARNPEGQQQFVSFYRFHLHDPVYFHDGIRVELQQLGAAAEFEPQWQTRFDEMKGLYGWTGPYVHPGMSDWIYERSDDFCSVAYWYQEGICRNAPPLPDRSARLAGVERQAWE